MIRIIKPHKPLVGSVMAGLQATVARAGLDAFALAAPMADTLWVWQPMAQGYVSQWPVTGWCLMPSARVGGWLAGRFTDQRGHVNLLTADDGHPLQFQSPEGAAGAVEQLNFTLWLMDWAVNRR